MPDLDLLRFVFLVDDIVVNYFSAIVTMCSVCLVALEVMLGSALEWETFGCFNIHYECGEVLLGCYGLLAPLVVLLAQPSVQPPPVTIFKHLQPRVLRLFLTALGRTIYLTTKYCTRARVLEGDQRRTNQL